MHCQCESLLHFFLTPRLPEGRLFEGSLTGGGASTSERNCYEKLTATANAHADRNVIFRPRPRAYPRGTPPPIQYTRPIVRMEPGPLMSPRSSALPLVRPQGVNVCSWLASIWLVVRLVAVAHAVLAVLAACKAKQDRGGERRRFLQEPKLGSKPRATARTTSRAKKCLCPSFSLHAAALLLLFERIAHSSLLLSGFHRTCILQCGQLGMNHFMHLWDINATGIT